MLLAERCDLAIFKTIIIIIIILLKLDLYCRLCVCICQHYGALWRDKLIAYIDVDDPIIDDADSSVDRPQQRLLHVSVSPSLTQLVDNLADEVGAFHSVRRICHEVGALHCAYWCYHKAIFVNF